MADVLGKPAIPRLTRHRYSSKPFKMSGQGPYFGQAFWFNNHHPEDVPSAKRCYEEEVMRVTKVLDGWLQDREYLVGGKCSFADLAFVTWYWLLGIYVLRTLGAKNQLEQDCPHWKAWIDRLNARPAVAKAYTSKEERIAEAKH